MVIWGVSALSHDASLAVLDGPELRFAAHAERYSRVKNDRLLNPGIIAEALVHGVPDAIAWYERPLLKKARHLRARQWTDAFAVSDLPGRYLRSLDLPFRVPDVVPVGHHTSHAMAGVATSGYDEAAVVVADAIGEFDTFTIAHYRAGEGLRVLCRQRYPDSLGLLYSAFTRRCGFKPNEDEYIVMGMAAFGEPCHTESIKRELIDVRAPGFRLRANVHRGIGDWLPDARPEDLAASIQAVTEEVMLNAAGWARRSTGSRNLILMGGVALNCVANTRIAEQAGFDGVWIFPNPGDAGSSVGAAAALYGKPVEWRGPYLGTDIDRTVEPDEIVRVLERDGMLALANGRAEFGPRALGNRSILADPRTGPMKDKVNAIKGRERFRPFAPVVPAEHAADFFEMPVAATPYMQFTVRCRKPDELPAVIHVDGTSRVQTVTARQHPLLHSVLTEWGRRTGVPVLLNTSLNSRGEPLVNTWEHATAFGDREGVAVL
ncbi:MAG TPA: carbamoyltransferase C-terminal domain-containing protein [Actinospica sp.]|jgi:carbamoyltransferase|nr:carbamoyltransferase C-terminal domain-containing protein [Actinospica sp.]